MLYQNLLIGTKPYHIRTTSYTGPQNHTGFQLHRHPDIELLYCLEGTYSVSVHNQTHQLQAGDLCVVGSMIAHEIFPKKVHCKTLTIDIGSVLLGEFFHSLASNSFAPVYHLAPEDPLRMLLEETAEIYCARTTFSELQLRGNLYKIGALLCEQNINSQAPEQNFQMVMKIEKALTLIYNHYAENISVDEAAAISGYSKSNFCAAFKKVVGDSFHHVLNQHRVNNACHLLRETAMPISDIALSVGFPDSKSFCRAFKQFLQTSPGTYRKLSGRI